MRIIFVDRVYERRPVKIAQLVNANIRSVMHGRNLIKSSLVECIKQILEVFYTNTCRKAMKSRMGRMCKPNMGWSNGSISRRLDHDIWYLHLCICVFVYSCICILYLWYLHLESVVFVFV